ncbi:hypothetical protein GBAR_LOCUS23661 [Geodia barretti]|uniref:Uncharacterized protein n=1 Tax=Geodia barretti TaxID=519541 RepID=A0AA35T812_GEOBA|nr:hypothetical protein GBAR_LOCUS23661 [Geodia barretti]
MRESNSASISRGAGGCSTCRWLLRARRFSCARVAGASGHTLRRHLLLRRAGAGHGTATGGPRRGGGQRAQPDPHRRFPVIG